MVWNQSEFDREALNSRRGVGEGSGFALNGEMGRAAQAGRGGGPEINVVASQANWAWPAALREIFRPRGVNLLVAESAGQFVSIIETKRIHTTIVDMDSEKSNALATIRIIRMDYPLMPCILLSSSAGESLLGKALQLDVFSVIDKPVDMSVLQEQLNRLFIKRYDSSIFA